MTHASPLMTWPEFQRFRNFDREDQKDFDREMEALAQHPKVREFVEKLHQYVEFEKFKEISRLYDNENLKRQTYCEGLRKVGDYLSRLTKE